MSSSNQHTAESVKETRPSVVKSEKERIIIRLKKREVVGFSSSTSPTSGETTLLKLKVMIALPRHHTIQTSMSTRTVARRTYTIGSLIFKFSNLKELVETLRAEGFNSLEGLRLVSDAYVHMDGCDEYHIAFRQDGVDFTRHTSNGGGVINPFDMSDDVEWISQINIDECSNSTKLYKLLDEHIRERAPYMQVFYDPSIVPSRSEYLLPDSLDGILSDDD